MLETTEACQNGCYRQKQPNLTDENRWEADVGKTAAQKCIPYKKYKLECPKHCGHVRAVSPPCSGGNGPIDTDGK